MSTNSDNWMLQTQTTYVLGLDHQVKNNISWQSAVTNILQGKMTPFMVHPTKRIHSAGGIDMAWPIIVRLNYWRNTPIKKPAKLTDQASRLNILTRDGWTCAYCGEHARTVDHIKPESLCRRDKDPFNGWTWGNLVAACFECNQLKRNRTPEEAGLTLLWSPHVKDTSSYAKIQKKVNEIVQTGEGYATDVNLYEGILE